MVRRVLKKILSLVTGKKAEPARPAPPPPPRRPAPRVLDDEDEGGGHDHGHSHGHSHDHGHSHSHAAPPAPPPPEQDHGHSHDHGHDHGHSHAHSTPAPASAVTVRPEQTPNPNAMKFTVNRKVSAKGSFSFNAAAEAAASPLGKALFAVPGVVGVFGVNDFVTVTKDDASSWDQLLGPIADALKASL